MGSECDLRAEHAYMSLSDVMFWAYMLNTFSMAAVLIWLILKKALWVAVFIQAFYTLALVIKWISLFSFYHPTNEVQPVSPKIAD